MTRTPFTRSTISPAPWLRLLVLRLTCVMAALPITLLVFVPILVQAADALSGARPGARREMLANYLKRLEDLEAIAKTFAGVEKSYAIQAGREIRIIVDYQKIGDDAATILARDIAKKIETDLSYPGQIRVTVIRETRAVEYAR